ncbi:MAG: flagellar basal body rod protein FlgC [Gemmatimonadaceae bacterium]|nr:flagellar basal body rod protein FlgC [Gemmatimonadaceae bacterium]
MTTIRGTPQPFLPLNDRTNDRLTPAPFAGLQIASSGLSAQRLRMEVATANLANAETTRTAEGGPYQRRVVTMEPTVSTAPSRITEGETVAVSGGVRVTGIAVDARPGDKVYSPGHADADADGMVTYPNVNPTEELVTIMEARRLYEANATAFNATKQMLRRAIDI